MVRLMELRNPVGDPADEPDEVYNLAVTMGDCDEPVHTGDTGMGSCDCWKPFSSRVHTAAIRRPRQVFGTRRHRRTADAVLPTVTVWRRQRLHSAGRPAIIAKRLDCSPLTMLFNHESPRRGETFVTKVTPEAK